MANLAKASPPEHPYNLGAVTPQSSAVFPINSAHAILRTEVIAPQPIPVTIITATDWPVVLATLTVGIGSIMTSLLIGWMTVIYQRFQVRSNIANFRHIWRENLREHAARFTSLGARIAYGIDKNPEYLKEDKSNQPFGELLEAQAHILLMIDTKKEYMQEINVVMNDIVLALRKPDTEQASNLSQSFLNKLSVVLELGWVDIKNDLRAK